MNDSVKPASIAPVHLAKIYPRNDTTTMPNKSIVAGLPPELKPIDVTMYL